MEPDHQDTLLHLLQSDADHARGWISSIAPRYLGFHVIADKGLPVLSSSIFESRMKRLGHQTSQILGIRRPTARSVTGIKSIVQSRRADRNLTARGLLSGQPHPDLFPFCGSKAGYSFVRENPKLKMNIREKVLVRVSYFTVFAQLYRPRGKKRRGKTRSCRIALSQARSSTRKLL